MTTRKPQMVRIILRAPRPVVATGASNELEGYSRPSNLDAQDRPRLFPNRHGSQDLANGDTEMSPHEQRVSSFVGDLVEMAKAYEELPKVQAELNTAKGEITAYLDMIQRLELKIIDHKNTENDLRSTIRSAEVARDDAELRFLEADERTTRALDFIKATFGNAGSLIQALEPPKPEVLVSTERQVEVTTSAPSSAIAPDDTVSPSEGVESLPLSETGLNISTEVSGTPNIDSQTTIVGQSAADPTVNSLSGNQSQSATSQDAETSEGVVQQTIADGPYANLRYYDHPSYVPLSAWLAGGGTEENYNWRPEPNRPNVQMG